MFPWSPEAFANSAQLPPSFPWEPPLPPPAPMPAVNKDELRARLRDFDYYREHFLRVRPRQGGERVPFILNNAQRVLHSRIEAERATFGMVRALIPKPAEWA